jgi:GTP pyrophosphokinase
MVSVLHSVASLDDPEQTLGVLAAGLTAAEEERLRAAATFADEVYGDAALSSGERTAAHALGMGLIVSGLKLDGDSRVAALLFNVPYHREHGLDDIAEKFGRSVSLLVGGVQRLSRLRPSTSKALSRPGAADDEITGTSPDGDDGDSRPEEAGSLGRGRAQAEVLRQMVLAMVEDVRVVLLRLASRTQTLRHYATNPGPSAADYGRDTLDLYAPLANRLGVWELKWELEDRSFRALEPDTYKRIAKMLDERRVEREQFIADAIARVRAAVIENGVTRADVFGRPKHIYSIWNKMRRKRVDFSEIYDVRALRVIVPDIKDCYTALGVVHSMWEPIASEFDDYISKPKDNAYRSLHTAVRCEDGRALEVQIRTPEMDHDAELGFAAHWRYKEGIRRTATDSYDDKIAWLRQLLTWKHDVEDSAAWVEQTRQAALDDTCYVLTPQGRVVDLPAGATPIDFAYRLHTELGHRCRGAKVNGQLVPLDTRLSTGQRVEIITAKQGGPSRDWLNPSSGYLATKSARLKVRRWFSDLAHDEALAEGRAAVASALQRLGQTGRSLDELASRLEFESVDELYLAAARGEISQRQFQAAFTDPGAEATADAIETKPSRADGHGVLVVGIDQLLTQMAQCCKPAPPDPIFGFVTRAKGVSIHRQTCINAARLAEREPERVIETAWGKDAAGVFAVDVIIEANDRRGLLRDISDIVTRERLNVVATATRAKHGRARMRFTVEVPSLGQLKRTLEFIRDVDGVLDVRRV